MQQHLSPPGQVSHHVKKGHMQVAPGVVGLQSAVKLQEYPPHIPLFHPELAQIPL